MVVFKSLANHVSCIPVQCPFQYQWRKRVCECHDAGEGNGNIPNSELCAVVTKHERCRYSLYIYLRINERTKNKINEDSYWKFKFWSIEREMFVEVMAQTVIRIRMTVTIYTLSITMNLSSRFITPRLKLSVNVDLFSFRSLLLDLCHCVEEDIRVFLIRFFRKLFSFKL